MSIIKEAGYAIKIVLVFIGVAILSALTSCESPTRAMSVPIEPVISINLIRHVSYDTVTVMKNGAEWAMYEVFMHTSYKSDYDNTMYYERHDTISIDVPEGDSATIYTHFLGDLYPNKIRVVRDSCYTLKTF